jgi:hypothetical protein
MLDNRCWMDAVRLDDRGEKRLYASDILATGQKYFPDQIRTKKYTRNVVHAIFGL